MKIQAQKNGRLDETERLEIARLLVKAGYTVHIGKVKKEKSCVCNYFIEFKEEEGI